MQYLALGQLLHSVVVGPLAVYLLFSDAEHNSHYSNSRWLEFVTVEISLAFFVAELFTTLIFFPDAFVQDKGDLIHHVFGVVGLLISVYRLNAIAMFRLLSQLSIPFLLLRLYLLECGKRDTLVYLLVYTALIFVHFVSRIAIFPWYWRLFAFSVQTEDATLSVVSVVILLFSLDVLNFYWFYSMIHTYVKYYPKHWKSETSLKCKTESLLI